MSLFFHCVWLDTFWTDLICIPSYIKLLMHYFWNFSFLLKFLLPFNFISLLQYRFILNTSPASCSYCQIYYVYICYMAKIQFYRCFVQLSFKSVMIKKDHQHLITFCIIITLASVAQWVGHRPSKRKVSGLIPSQGICLGCRQGPRLVVHLRQPIDVSLSHWCFSLYFSLSHFLSLKINK